MAWRVTLAPGPITRLSPVKAAVLVAKGIVPRDVPLFESVMLVMPAEPVPVPVLVMVRVVKVTVELLGLLKTT